MGFAVRLVRRSGGWVLGRLRYVRNVAVIGALAVAVLFVLDAVLLPDAPRSESDR